MDPEQDPGCDYLSDLPDDLILSIMSLLRARQAVQTCVLSRRWRDLWRSLPRINADVDEFTGENKVHPGDETRFKKFVNTLLLRRDPVPLADKFWLKYSIQRDVSIGTQGKEASADANLWISHALQMRAPDVVVEMINNTLMPDLPVFTSRFLRRLGLTVVYLPKGFFKKLETGCPALEELVLDDCIIMDDDISSRTLKVLTIRDSELSDTADNSITTPSLISLILCDCYGRIPLLKDMTSLVSASVFLEYETINFDNAIDVRRMLTSLSGVRNLELGDEFDFREQLEQLKNMQWCPKFNNLVSLTLDQWCLDSNFYALTVFLQNSPKLEKLTVKLYEDEDHTARITAKLGDKSFTCEHLKIVEIIVEEDYCMVYCIKGFFFDSGMTSLRFIVHNRRQRRYSKPEFLE